MPKKSFFEKLTGASWSEDDPSEGKSKLIKTKLVKKSSSKKSSAKKSKLGKSGVILKKEQKEPSPKKVGKNEDWLNESEGQLTIDVYQTPSEIVIKSTIAGVKPEDIDITMANDMITIKGTRQKDEEAKEEDYYYQECYWGPFSRSVILPVDVEVDQAQASMKNGILTIRLPKIEKVKTRKIVIQSE